MAKKLFFLKSFRSYRKDQVAVVSDNIAKVLIVMGAAEIYKVETETANTQKPDVPETKKRGRPSKKDKEIVTSEPDRTENPPAGDKGLNTPDQTYLNRAMTTESN